jgi:hypothetical protein
VYTLMDAYLALVQQCQQRHLNDDLRTNEIIGKGLEL